MSAATETGPRLRRSLHLWDLIIYGLILIQPTAPMPPFGSIFKAGHGHVVTTVLIAMVAMLFTAISYGRMARAYPSAGSAFTYVGQEIHPALGYVTGWSMLMDYVVNPVICTIWCAKAGANIGLPYEIWVVFFALLFTALNLRGIQSTARTNSILAAAMSVVIVWFLVAAVRYMLGTPELTREDFVRPFYDRQTFSWPILFAGTSTAVLTYIGFDGISTLSEEVHNPRKNILYATVLVCLIIGVLSAIEVYAAQVLWRDRGETFRDLDTACVEISGIAGGRVLFHVVNFTLLVASIGSGMGAQLGAARLLYGMGRDDAIPKRFFGSIDPKNQIPRNNVLLLGAVVLIGAFAITYDLGVHLLNFGALIGFMGVNAAAIMHYWVRGGERHWSYLVPPALGFLICAAIWWSVHPMAKRAGIAWLLIGVAYGAWKTRGFRRPIHFAVE